MDRIEDYTGPWSHYSETDQAADLRWGAAYTDHLTEDDPALPYIKEQIAISLAYMLLEHDLIKWIVKPPPTLAGEIPDVSTVAGVLKVLKPSAPAISEYNSSSV